MKFNLAFTSPINPTSVSPILTHEQVWAGLVRKCRKPQDMISVLSDCEVLEENENGLTRIVTFEPGMGPPAGKEKEVITYYGQTTVRDQARVLLLSSAKCVPQAHFQMASGSFVTNTISHGEGENELYLTFTFEWHFPDLEEGSKLAEEKYLQLRAQAATAVSRTIDVIRGWVRDGNL